jgi:integrase
MQQDEIVQLEWRCIDLIREVAIIHKIKGSKLRAVPLSKGAIAILRRQPKTNLSQIVLHRTDGQTMDWVSSQFGATARRLASKWSQKWPQHQRFCAV